MVPSSTFPGCIQATARQLDPHVTFSNITNTSPSSKFPSGLTQLRRNSWICHFRQGPFIDISFSDVTFSDLPTPTQVQARCFPGVYKPRRNSWICHLPTSLFAAHVTFHSPGFRFGVPLLGVH